MKENREHSLSVTRGGVKYCRLRDYELTKIFMLGKDSIELLLTRDKESPGLGWLKDYAGCLSSKLFDLDLTVMLTEEVFSEYSKSHKELFLLLRLRDELFKLWFIRVIFHYNSHGTIRLYEQMRIDVNRPRKAALYLNSIIKSLMAMFCLNYENEGILCDLI